MKVKCYRIFWFEVLPSLAVYGRNACFCWLVWEIDFMW